MARKTLYGLMVGEPGTQRREETLGKLESMGWFASHADWGLKSVQGSLVKLTPSRYRDLAKDLDFESVPSPGEDIVVLVLKIPETEADQAMDRGTDIRVSLQ